MAVPSGMYHIDRPPNTASFTFMWSYPNMVSTAFCTTLFDRNQLLTKMARFLCLPMRYIISGKPWLVLTSWILTEHLEVVIQGEIASRECLKVLKSLFGPWAI
jgi:hypothetical protein